MYIVRPKYQNQLLSRMCSSPGLKSLKTIVDFNPDDEPDRYSRVLGFDILVAQCTYFNKTPLSNLEWSFCFYETILKTFHNNVN